MAKKQKRETETEPTLDELLSDFPEIDMARRPGDVTAQDLIERGMSQQRAWRALAARVRDEGWTRREIVEHGFRRYAFRKPEKVTK